MFFPYVSILGIEAAYTPQNSLYHAYDFQFESRPTILICRDNSVVVFKH